MRMYARLFVCFLFSTSITGLAQEVVPVTVDDFVRAESDNYFSEYVANGAFGEFLHRRQPPSVEDQDVVRLNRDTLYSIGIFDLSEPVTITKPETGDRYQSMMVINQDHYVTKVAYDAGSYTLTQKESGTRYVMVVFRTFADPNDPVDLAEAHELQDLINVTQSDRGTFVVPQWNQEELAALRKEVRDLQQFVPDSVGMFGSKEEVDPVRHLIGAAVGWGGNPTEDAKYILVVPEKNDGETPYELRVPADVPVKGFWSITVYDAQGYLQANPQNAYSINNVTAERNADGSVTVNFGGDPEAPNYIGIMPGWNYTVRLYRPEAAILNGSWTFPAAVPVERFN